MMRTTIYQIGFKFHQTHMKVLAWLATYCKKNLNLLQKSVTNNVSFFSGQVHLEMTKADGDGFYDDGLAFVFKDEDGELMDVKPFHIHVEVQSGSIDVETCDLRLYSVQVSDETEEEKNEETVCANDEFATGGGPDIEMEGANPTKEKGSPDDRATRLLNEEDDESEETFFPEDGDDSEESDDDDTNGDEKDGCAHGTVTIAKSPEGFDKYVKVKHSDVAFMRMGFFYHLKLNTDSMLKMYSEDEWLAVDMLIDWEEQTVSIYVDQEAIRAVPFFTKRTTKLTHVNTLAIYGLTPGGVSRFRNLRVCDDICDEGKQLPHIFDLSTSFRYARRFL